MQTYSQKLGTIIGPENKLMLLDNEQRAVIGYNYNFGLKKVVKYEREYEEFSAEWQFSRKITHTIHPFTLEGVPCINLRRSAGIDLKTLQDVLHNAQQVMAGYSQDDAWSDYDRQAHANLIEMQYAVEDNIRNAQYASQPTQQLTDAQIDELALKEYPYPQGGDDIFYQDRKAYSKGIKAASQQQGGMRWIKASEKLPNRKAEYFVIVDDYKSVAIFDGNMFFSNDNILSVNKWLDENTNPIPQEIILDGNNNLLNVKW